MFLPFFAELRKGGLPVSLREFLTFLEALKTGLVTYDVEGFYYLARAALVKDERNIDRFDRAFARAFEGLEAISLDQVLEAVDLPADWLEKMAEKHLSEDEKAEIAALGGFEGRAIGAGDSLPIGAGGGGAEGATIAPDLRRTRWPFFFR